MLTDTEIKMYANLIDHTNLKPFITDHDWEILCQQAVQYGFKTVAINNAGIEICSHYLEGSNVLVDAAVSFPLGQCTMATKVFETKDAIQKGAGEVDYVVNISQIKNGNWEYIQEEMKRIVFACKEKTITSKVIFENCYLTDDEKKHLCEIAMIVKPDFIKTSTGFGTGGATISDVKLMKSMVADEIKIKAAGGIRTAEDFLSMIAVGANRIGTSSGMKIIDQMHGDLEE